LASVVAMKAEADIGEVGAKHPHRADRNGRCRSRPTARSGHRTLPGLRHEREWRYLSGVATRAGGYQDQAVAPFSIALCANFLVDHVREKRCRPAMRGLIEFFARRRGR